MSEEVQNQAATTEAEDLGAEIVFDSPLPVEVPISFRGSKYLLVEASGEVACRYRNAILAASKLSRDGKTVSINGLADTQLLLISLCLFEAEPRKAVKLDELKKWPAKFLEVLFTRAKAISGIDSKETKEKLLAEKAKLDKKLARLEGNRDEEQVKN